MAQACYHQSPLSKRSGTSTYYWADKLDRSFQQTKVFMAQDCQFALPSLLIPFHIYKNTFKYQILAYISYWLYKFNDAQIHNTMGNTELNFIVMIYTDIYMMLHNDWYQALHSYRPPQYHHCQNNGHLSDPFSKSQWKLYLIPGKDNHVTNVQYHHALISSVLWYFKGRANNVYLQRLHFEKNRFCQWYALVECLLHLPSLQVQEHDPIDYK